MSFDREAGWFAVLFAGVTLLLGCWSVHLRWLGIILTVWCLYFFRDPERVHPLDDGHVLVSPADGKVVAIGLQAPPAELGLQGPPLQKVSIFMSVFSVHVNRAPMGGVIEKIVYVPGKFFNATLDKASEENEREITLLQTSHGLVVYTRIAGLIARRIRRDVLEGETLKLGQRVGIIRFGSRVEVYLPAGAILAVEEGQTMIAGETVMARFAKKAHAT
ncbi:MAG: phosphatidylserine decarboxylase [Holosporales bacterium]|jgi:phosphatidylserine decarboxylase|nr:phosphatidylserine decarboxylase [Holosporales bacterium]